MRRDDAHLDPGFQRAVLGALRDPLRGAPLHLIRDALEPGSYFPGAGCTVADRTIEALVAQHLVEWVSSGDRPTHDWTVRVLSADQSSRHRGITRAMVEPDFGPDPQQAPARERAPYCVIEVSPNAQRKSEWSCLTRPIAVDRVRSERDHFVAQQAFAHDFPRLQAARGFWDIPRLWVVCRNAGRRGGPDVRWLVTDVVENRGSEGSPLWLSDVMGARLDHHRVDWRGLLPGRAGAPAL